MAVVWALVWLQWPEHAARPSAGEPAPRVTVTRDAAPEPSEPVSASADERETPVSRSRLPKAVAASDTVRIRVPSIGVDAPVVPMGLDDDGALEVPAEPDQAGWWSGGSSPGERGPAVFVGHRDSAEGPAVFYDVAALQPGAVIEVVDADGREHRFEVERTEQHPRDDFPTEEVYGATPVPTLRLLTCGGDYDSWDGYEDNVIVFATAL